LASIPIPVQTAPDQLSMQIENECETWLARCQAPSGQLDLAGKNAAMKANMQLMQTALAAWSTALSTQIGTL
jgi:hypothetical protein